MPTRDRRARTTIPPEVQRIVEALEKRYSINRHSVYQMLVSSSIQAVVEYYARLEAKSKHDFMVELLWDNSPHPEVVRVTKKPKKRPQGDISPKDSPGPLLAPPSASEGDETQ